MNIKILIKMNMINKFKTKFILNIYNKFINIKKY